MRSERDKKMELSTEIVGVADKGVTMARDRILMAEDSVEKDRAMQRQLPEATQNQNALWPHTQTSGYRQCSFKPGPSHVLQPLDNTGNTNSSQLDHCSSAPRGHSLHRLKFRAVRSAAPGSPALLCY